MYSACAAWGPLTIRRAGSLLERLVVGGGETPEALLRVFSLKTGVGRSDKLYIIQAFVENMLWKVKAVVASSGGFSNY
ncbi:hypothetical protein TNCV_1481791 [Trichonephila clavipes]|nr:hypothetical protein TNCV_1481791 [Trichonephila clavipes]